MAITREDVENAASIACLELSEEDIGRYTEQLGSFLDYAAVLGHLDTDEVQPTLYVVSVQNVLREDLQGEEFDLKKTLQNAPDAEDGFFKVPKIV